MSDEDLDIDEVLVLEEVSVELALAVWEPTGDAGIDAALDELTRLEDLPPGAPGGVRKRAPPIASTPRRSKYRPVTRHGPAPARCGANEAGLSSFPGSSTRSDHRRLGVGPWHGRS